MRIVFSRAMSSSRVTLPARSAATSGSSTLRMAYMSEMLG